MYNVIIENIDGEQLDLVNNKNMFCIDIDGVNGANAVINETENASVDGSVINSERIDSRTIVLTIRIFNNYGECRLALYQHAQIKKYVKLTLINDVRSVYIEGKVKSIECDPHTQKETATISIVCPEPFFNEAMAIITEFSNIIKMFYFEFAIEESGIPFGVITDTIQAEVVNIGECDTGVVFVLKAKGTVTNPKIINMENGEYFRLNYTMRNTEEIRISTISKHKSIISIYNNVETDLLGMFDMTSNWLQAVTGSNNYTYTADSGADKLESTVEFQNKYIGV